MCVQISNNATVWMSPTEIYLVFKGRSIVGLALLNRIDIVVSFGVMFVYECRCACSNISSLFVLLWFDPHNVNFWFSDLFKQASIFSSLLKFDVQVTVSKSFDVWTLWLDRYIDITCEYNTHTVTTHFLNLTISQNYRYCIIGNNLGN